MYTVSKVSKKKRRKKFFVNGEEVCNLVGFTMISHKKNLSINGMNICNIVIMNKYLARPLASKKVAAKFNKLINLLTELIVSDDDTGDAFREALNQIEKFRLEIKNKYRMFLEKKELEAMSKKLKLLKTTAENKLIELNNYSKVTNRGSKGR